ncbi:glycerol-3-phosphate ABC transporter [Klebsiella pneumoniae]|uniref:Glycerol-3-phosphate ABC transporter n=1 Tax=Klebsiella pneumoniae TaxID=573 RepID=A0A4P0YHN3_KLEPN|nr:glycerol-3-phosphate ABC transporter [Klebsiella pneumoniae]
MKCGYASGWQGWIQIENFSAWHGLPVATKNNGFDGTDAVLEFNKPEQVKHIALLEEMNKKGDFSYFGRKDESTEKFYKATAPLPLPRPARWPISASTPNLTTASA